jgi:hypothetical protein
MAISLELHACLGSSFGSPDVLDDRTWSDTRKSDESPLKNLATAEKPVHKAFISSF